MRSANDIGDSTTMEKFTVCLIGFGFSCLAFLLSATVLVPVTGFISNVFALPDIVPQVLILLELFALPVVAALVGVSLAARPIARRGHG